MPLPGCSGMQRLLARHWRDGLVELQRSLFAGAQVRNLQRYVPELRPEHVQPGYDGANDGAARIWLVRAI